MPIIFFVGSVRLSPYRLFLVVTFIPCFIAWLSGSIGRIRLTDMFMFLTATWGAIVLVHLHSVSSVVQPAGIFFVETFGSFLVARLYIRNVRSFQYMVRCLLLVVAFLLPFGAYENVTGSPILVEALGQIFTVHVNAPKQPRLGLSRAQGVFEHPILFGVVCSSGFALSYYVLGSARRLIDRLGPGIVAMAVFSSLSAGAFLSVAIQGILIGWDKITAKVARRWVMLIILAITAYILVDNLSNRNPFQVFTSYLTFNADQSYMRILIWNYGTQSVLHHPIFGVGLNEWDRPSWMAGSIDNFWLNNAVTFGIPGLSLIVGSVLSVCIGLGRLRDLSFEVAQCRKGLLITLAGLVVAICTVHLWNASYVLFTFLLGSGMWMFDNCNGAAVATSYGPRKGFYGNMPRGSRPLKKALRTADTVERM